MDFCSEIWGVVTCILRAIITNCLISMLIVFFKNRSENLNNRNK